MKRKICPKCNSTDIEDVTEKENSMLLTQYASPKVYRCKQCGFESFLFPEIEVN